MSDVPASRRGSGAGGRERSGEATTVLPLAMRVRAIPDGAPAISIEDSP